MRRFIDLMKVQNDNLEILREDEAFLDRTLMQLAAAIAYDCGQWPDPDRYVSPNVEVVTSAARYGALLREEWQTKGGLLVFGGGMSMALAMDRLIPGMVTSLIGIVLLLGLIPMTMGLK